VTLTGRDTGDGYLRGLVSDGVVMVEGPLVDRFCWEDREGITLDTNVDLTIDPLNHTIHCLVEVEVCRTSGYVIVAEGDDGIWETAYILDESQNEDVIAMMLDDYPDLILNGNANLPVYGYSVVLMGIDYGDGYLRALDTEVISVTGPLVDRFCWETREGFALDTNADLTQNPLNHTLHCLVEVERCRESGYLILEQVGGVWQVAYILDDTLNGEAIMAIMDDHPEVMLNGNNAPSLGYTITISGIDSGDGYLRSEFAEDVTTTEAVAVDTACPDDFTNLGAMGSFGDFTVGIEIDCVEGTVTMDIQHTAYNGQWLGLVFSENMLGTALIYTTGNAAGASEAARDIGLYQYENTNRAGNAVNWDDSITWTEVSTDETDGVLQIIYTAPLEGSPIDLSDPENVQLRWAMGTDSPAITYHQTGRSSDVLGLDLLTGGANVQTVDMTGQYLHGVIMWFTWAVLASFGIMSSAFRFLYPTGPTWFKIHRGVQVSVVVLHLIAFIMAVAFTEEAGVEHFSNDHMKCGLAVTILCVLQPLNAVLRAHPPMGGWKGGVAPVKRQVWEFVHKKSGYIAWILGCVTAFLGMRLPQIDAIMLSEFHMYGWCLGLLVIYLVLSVLKCNNAVQNAEVDAMNTKQKSMEPKDTVEMLTAAGTTKVDTAGSPAAGEDREESLSINN